MKNYQQAEEFLSGGRAKNRRPLSGKSTSMIRRSPDSIAIRYHNTDVVTYFANGDVMLNSDGFRTVTTKARMNEYAPINIWQQRGVWYVLQDVIYQDGMIIRADGTFKGAGKPQQSKKEIQKRDQASKFAKEYMAAFYAGKVPKPGNGDCLYCNCGLKSQTGQTLGETVRNKDHILSHMKEKYYVPSMLVNALKAAGCGDAYFWALQEFWERGPESLKTPDGRETFHGSLLQNAPRFLRRYIHKQLGMVA